MSSICQFTKDQLIVIIAREIDQKFCWEPRLLSLGLFRLCLIVLIVYYNTSMFGVSPLPVPEFRCTHDHRSHTAIVS